MSSVDLTLDASCILVSCKQRIEILLSRQYCMALLFKETPLWSIPCGSYNFIIESNVEMPAILKEASATGVLLISASVNTRRNDRHPFVRVSQREAGHAAGKEKRKGKQSGKEKTRGRKRVQCSEIKSSHSRKWTKRGLRERQFVRASV